MMRGEIDPIRRRDIDELLAVDAERCVSLFMPTHPGGPETRQDPIRLRNLLNAAREAGAHEATLEAGRHLLEDDDFWQHQGHGLALFLDGGLRRWRVGIELEERVEVGSRFTIRPLLPLLTRAAPFFLLAMSANAIRLFRCDEIEAVLVEPEDLPKDLASFLRYDDPQREVQWHSRSQAPGPGGQRRPVMFHGHGSGRVGRDERSEEIARYARAIDRSVARAVPEGAPLVLAGDVSLISAFRDLTTIDSVMDEELSGNPDHLAPEHLRATAHRSVLERAQEGRAGRTQRLVDGTDGGRVVSGAGEAVRSAARGLMDTLFLAEDAGVWGRWEPGQDLVVTRRERQEGDEDLLDLAAVLTLKAGGDVVVLPAEELPVDEPVAGLLRGVWAEQDRRAPA